MSISLSTSGRTPKRQFQWMTAAAKWADTIGPMVRSELRHEAPVAKLDPAGRNRPGRLRASIRYERHTTGRSVTAEFTAYTPYAGFVIDGTKPHIIRPVAARYLMFYQNGAQRFVGPRGSSARGAYVQHPGTKPNPFNRRAVDRMMPVVQQTYRDIMIAAIGETSL